ncbi:hypothetical protein AGMMS50255_2790 [Spirochaetia bacterium]|nr:hypothetical protein AGMMS50255_2790 [Spirochaetia bacterium]
MNFLLSENRTALKTQKSVAVVNDTNITDWDAAEDFKSKNEMAFYLEDMFSDGNTTLMLDAINDVARSKGLKQIAKQAESLQGKNPSFDILKQMVNTLGFCWENNSVIPV